MKNFIWIFLWWPWALAGTQGELKCTYAYSREITLTDTGKTQRIESVLPNGVEQTVVINDPVHFNEVDNYVIHRQRQYTMTYALSCLRLK